MHRSSGSVSLLVPVIVVIATRRDGADRWLRKHLNVFVGHGILRINKNQGGATLGLDVVPTRFSHIILNGIKFETHERRVGSFQPFRQKL